MQNCTNFLQMSEKYGFWLVEQGQSPSLYLVNALNIDVSVNEGYPSALARLGVPHQPYRQCILGVNEIRAVIHPLDDLGRGPYNRIYLADLKAMWSSTVNLHERNPQQEMSMPNTVLLPTVTTP